MKSTKLAVHLGRFFKIYLKSDRNLSQRTIQSYSQTFSLFLKYMLKFKGIEANKLDFKEFNRKNIEDFLRNLESTCCAKTINQRRAAFCCFCKYLEYEEPSMFDEINAISTIPQKKESNKAISYLKVDGINLFLKQIDIQTPKGLRDFVMLSIMITMGLRVSELINIKARNIQMSAPATITVMGKGSKERILCIPDKIFPYLKKYIEGNQLNKPENLDRFIFLNHMNQQFTRQGVTYIVTKYRELARKVNPSIIPENLSNHKLRHTCGVMCAEAGVDPLYIRDILGHVSVVTTEVYMGTKSLESKSKALEKVVDGIIDDASDISPLWEADKNLFEFLTNLSKKSE